MHIVFFASGGPGNLKTAFDTEAENSAGVRVGLVIADRPQIPAIDLARERGTPCIVVDVATEAAKLQITQMDQHLSARETAVRRIHDRILDRIVEFELRLGWRFDLAVLAYRRIIRGNLLRYFRDRMINQHPADLASRDARGARKYTGLGGLSRSITSGEVCTRTSTILVNDSVDGGEILCRGPSVHFKGDRSDPESICSHEQLQKKCSDRPSLRFAINGIAAGDFSLSHGKVHPDGCRLVHFRGRALPYGGVDATEY